MTIPSINGGSNFNDKIKINQTPQVNQVVKPEEQVIQFTQPETVEEKENVLLWILEAFINFLNSVLEKLKKWYNIYVLDV